MRWAATTSVLMVVPLSAVLLPLQDGMTAGPCHPPPTPACPMHTRAQEAHHDI